MASMQLRAQLLGLCQEVPYTEPTIHGNNKHHQIGQLSKTAGMQLQMFANDIIYNTGGLNHCNCDSKKWSLQSVQYRWSESLAIQL